MQGITLNVLGHDISFKAGTDPQRINRVHALLEERFETIKQHGAHISKEKLLTFLALALADDFVLLCEQQEEVQKRLNSLLMTIENI